MTVGKIAVLLAVLVLFGTCAYADECNTVRYDDMGNGTVQDCRTGLIWLMDADCIVAFKINGVTNDGNGLNWPDALKWVSGLYGDGSGSTVCGLSDGSSAGDWRLPTKTEWMAMVAYAIKQKYLFPALTNGIGDAKWTQGNLFNNVQPTGGYWSSTTVASSPASAWYVDILAGDMGGYGKTDKYGYYVWPVRGGQAGSFGTLRIE